MTTAQPLPDREEGSWERVTAALERVVGPGRPAGAWMKYCCPVHETGPGRHNPSLIAKHLTDAGRTKVQCRAGCDDREVLDRLGLQIRDLYDAPIERARGYRPARQPQPRRATRAELAINAAGMPLAQPKRDRGQQLSPWQHVTAYPYVRDDGTVAGEVVREEARFEHGRDKRFFQHRWDEQRGRMVDGGFDRIPYQLPQLLDAIRDGQPVAICEGEKDADALTRAGLVATTNTGGALSWTDEHARWLHGAGEVLVVVDRDPAGYRRADKVLATLAGRVGAVRVMQAATGKDAADHLAAGHGLDELDPVPYLDPATPAAARTSGAAVPFAREVAGGSAGPVTSPTHPPHPDLDGGTDTMGEFTGLDQGAAQHHDDTIDHIGARFAQLVRMLMQEIMTAAQRSAEQRRRDWEKAQADEEAAQRAYDAQVAAERNAVEGRLAALRKAGWDRASRGEIASALQDAAEWSDHSDAAKRALSELTGHIRQRYGVHVDPVSGHVTVDNPSDLSGRLAAAEQDRAAASRLATTQDRMVQLVGAEESLDESAKAALYAEIETWRHNPTPAGLKALDAKVQAAGVSAQTRTKIRYVAVYLGGPATEQLKITELGSVPGLSPTTELRRLEEPLVDPAEETKPRIDALLQRYQDRLRHGVDTKSVADQLADAVAVLTEEDRQKARERGKAIRKDPSGEYAKLWPKHVDREELAATVSAYAGLAPVVEDRIAREDGLDADWSIEQRKRCEALRKEIDTALASGKGLHDWEKDQLRAVLASIEAGDSTVPDVLFADDRTAAAVDRDRADEQARTTASHHGRAVEEILQTGAAPADTVRRVSDDIRRVVVAQTSLAAGRTSLHDYEETGADGLLLAKLRAAGVPEHVRNRVRNQLDHAGRDSAITGKQARRIQDRWADRRDLVAAGRGPDKPPYDSPERRANLESRLRATDLTPDEVEQRMAADAGFAKPASAAVREQGSGPAKGRSTAPGSGVRRINHRRKDEPGRGL